MKHKIKLGIILGVEFVAIAVILLLIFFAGKKSYTVTFDLNGGTLISGDLEQVVPQGKSATPPTVAKDGCYLHSWSASYKQITHDIVIEAVWEWEISTGFEYTDTENRDYCEIVKSYEHLFGDVFVGVYHDEKPILGIQDNAFYDRDGISNIYMLDGILYVGANAFADCDRLEYVELSGTIRYIGENAFLGCKSLKTVILPEDLEEIPANAFKDCVSLEEIVIPASVKRISESAFAGCTSLTKITFLTEDITEVDEETKEEKIVGTKGLEIIETGAFADCESLTEIMLPNTIKEIDVGAFTNPELTVYLPFNQSDVPEGFAFGWNGPAGIEWGYVAPESTEDSSEAKSGRRQ